MTASVSPDDSADLCKKDRTEQRKLALALQREKRGEQGRIRASAFEKEKERAIAVKWAISRKFSIEQMMAYLPLLGIPAGRTRVYDYLHLVKVPKWWARDFQTDARQSVHDYYCNWAMIRLLQGFHEKGLWPELYEKDVPAWEGFKFRPDWKIELTADRKYRWFLEVQLSDLTDTLWRKKLRHYVSLRKKTKKLFRVLVILDQQKDMSYVRSVAREILRDEGLDADMFQFLKLKYLKAGEMIIPENIVFDGFWLSTWGKHNDGGTIMELSGTPPRTQRS